MLPAKPFYLIRHGETVANAGRISAGGGLDSPLTERGVAQAKEVAKAIHSLEVKPSKIYHSSMVRARDTATYINKALGLEMEEIHEIREHELGEWEGQPWDDVLPHLHNNVRPIGGENRDDFAIRIKDAISQILDNHSEKEAPPMLVAHGGLFFGIMDIYGWRYSGPFHNCHLHYFAPQTDHEAFPWHVCHFDVHQDALKRQKAVFCPRVHNPDEDQNDSIAV